MNWYWVIRDGNPVDDPFVSDTADLGGFSAHMLRMGKPIDEWPTSAWIKASDPSNDGDPDDSLQNHLGILIFSQRLREALSSTGIQGVQYLPLTVIRPSGLHIEGFAAVNILNGVSALDLEASTYERFPDDYFIEGRRGDLCSLQNVTLRAKALDGLDIVRLREYDVAAYVSDRFRDLFERGQFTGLEFKRVNLS